MLSADPVLKGEGRPYMARAGITDVESVLYKTINYVVFFFIFTPGLGWLELRELMFGYLCLADLATLTSGDDR